jgi:glycosyltransferase involved in cell wall biosynthesis
MIQGFCDDGHTVEVLVMGKAPNTGSINSNPKNFKSLVKKFIPKIIWRTLKEIQQIRFDKHAAKELQEAIQTFNPDMVYERSAWMSNGSIEVVKPFKTKHIVEINAPFEEEVEEFENASSFIAFVGTKKLKHLLQSANLVAPITSSLQKHIVKNYDINPRQCLVVPNAIDKAEIQITDSRVEEIRRNLDLTNKTVVGFVGSIFPYHGVGRLIQAVANLNNSNVVLLIVGDGYMIPELKEQAKIIGLSSRVHFTGSVRKEDVYNYITAMDVVTLPNTEWYCSPVKLFEYGALGKTILAVNEAGVSDVMSNEEGVLFENNDTAFQEALLTSITDVEELQIKAGRFQEKILSNHTWRANAHKIIQQINSVQ